MKKITFFVILMLFATFVSGASVQEDFTFIQVYNQTIETNGTVVSAQVYNSTWLEFDGINDGVNCSNDVSFNIDHNISMMGFVNMAGNGGTHKILDKDGAYRLYVDADNTTRCNVYGLDDTFPSGSSDLLYVNNWYTLTCVYNGTHINTYKNQELQISDTATGNVTVNTNDVFIGASSAFNNEFNGSISAVKLFNKSLSTRQVVMFNSEFQNNKKQRIVQLTFHKVDDSVGDTYTINTTNLDYYMSYLYNNGFESINFGDYFSARLSQYALPEKSVIIVFDDGYDDVINNAKPILDNYGFVGEVGVITTVVGTAGYMTWDNLSLLYSDGWGIQSHSINSTNLKTVNSTIRAFMYNASKNAIIANLSVAPSTFIFPQNSQNVTLRDECLLYYEGCTGLTTDMLNTSYALRYIYLSSDMSSDGLMRISTDNLSDQHGYFEEVVDPNSKIILDLRLNENTGSITYDSSLNNNHGNISGATWNNDNITVDLVSGVDFFSNASYPVYYQLINPFYDYSYVMGVSSNPNSLRCSIAQLPFCAVNTSCPVSIGITGIMEGTNISNYNHSLIVHEADGTNTSFSQSSTIYYVSDDNEDNHTYSCVVRYVNQSQFNVTVHDPYVTKYRIPFNVYLKFYRQNDSDEYQQYMDEFNIVYLQKVGTSSNFNYDFTFFDYFLPESMDLTNFDDTIVHWAYYVDGVANVTLYEVEDYDVHLMSTKVLGVSWPYEFFKPQHGKIKFDSDITELYINESATFKITLSDFEVSAMTTMMGWALGILIFAVWIVILVVLATQVSTPVAVAVATVTLPLLLTWVMSLGI